MPTFDGRERKRVLETSLKAAQSAQKVYKTFSGALTDYDILEALNDLVLILETIDPETGSVEGKDIYAATKDRLKTKIDEFEQLFNKRLDDIKKWPWGNIDLADYLDRLETADKEEMDEIDEMMGTQFVKQERKWFRIWKGLNQVLGQNSPNKPKDYGIIDNLEYITSKEPRLRDQLEAEGVLQLAIEVKEDLIKFKSFVADEVKQEIEGKLRSYRDELGIKVSQGPLGEKPERK